MAQTKRKRQTKHRGNAAGVVESRGRTGRKPTAAEKSGKGRAPPGKGQARWNATNEPPTWLGAFYRAMAAAVLMLLISILLLKKPNEAIALFPIVPDRVRADQLLHRHLAVQPPMASKAKTRRHARRAGRDRSDRRALFTVGPIQENAYIVGPRRAGDCAR